MYDADNTAVKGKPGTGRERGISSPMIYLPVEALERFRHFYGDGLPVELWDRLEPPDDPAREGPRAEPSTSTPRPGRGSAQPERRLCLAHDGDAASGDGRMRAESRERYITVLRPALGT